MSFLLSFSGCSQLLMHHTRKHPNSHVHTHTPLTRTHTPLTCAHTHRQTLMHSHSISVFIYVTTLSLSKLMQFFFLVTMNSMRHSLLMNILAGVQTCGEEFVTGFVNIAILSPRIYIYLMLSVIIVDLWDIYFIHEITKCTIRAIHAIGPLGIFTSFQGH